MSFSIIKKTVPAGDGRGSIDQYPLAPINSDAAARRRSYLATTALTAALLSILAGGIRPATAANFTWDSTGATTTTNNYNLDTNWGPATAPITAGQAAIFANTGNTSVNVSSGPIAPDSWIFNANSQSYTITGAAVNFGTGLTNNANAGQTLSVSNSMTGTLLSQASSSVLTIFGTNSFTNTTITQGALTNEGSLTSAINNSAFFINGGTVTGTLTNTGTVNFSGGAMNGNVNNSTGGVFQVFGATTSNSAFTNATASSLLSIAGSGSIVIDGIGSGYGFGLVNSGAAASGGGVTLAANGYLRVGYGIQNNAGADIVNAGTINSGGALLAYADNLGNIANTGTGTFVGLVANGSSGTIGNTGTWNGELKDNQNITTSNAVDNQNVWTGDATNHGNLHNSGTWTTTTTGTGFRNSADGIVSQTAGTIDATLGGFSNIGNSAAHSAIVNFSGGAINGAITNGAFGTFNVLGSVTSDTTFDNSAASSLLSLGSGASYTLGGLLTNAGTVLVGNGATLTATAGGITNAAGGTITVNAGGTIVDDLTNAGTVVNNGAYVANVASNTGTITNAGIWTGDLLSNTGSIVNSGGATWNGDAANGGTLLNAGTLNGNLTNLAGTTTNTGTITGGVSVNGGMLTGDGSTGALTVTSGGRFAPGNGTPGTSATVNGNLILQAGAFYQVAINPATASFANVTGTATLGGATVNAVYANGSYVAKRYTILTATGGVSGSFSGPVNTNLPSNFTSSLSYDTNNAFLDLALGFLPGNGGLNVNQANVANALTNFFNTNGGIPIAFGTLNSAGLTTASGELATGAQQTTFNAMNLFMSLMMDPLAAGRGEADAGLPSGEPNAAMSYASGEPVTTSAAAYAAISRKAPLIADPFAQRWGTWFAGYGGSQSTDGNAALGSNATTSRVYGSAAGVDYRISPFTRVGLTVAGGGTNFSIANGLGTGRSDLFQAGAFIRHDAGAAYVSGALAYGWQDITTNRTVALAGIDQLQARFNANAFSGRIEGGYRLLTPWMGLTPYAAGQFTTFDLPAYVETVLSGGNSFALSYAAKQVTSSRSELGLRADKSFGVENGIFTLRGRAAWAHDFNTDRTIAAAFQTLPGASFVVNGAAQASNAALTTASAEMKWLNGVSLSATFEGEFSAVTRSYAGKGVARYSW
jgi:uncharacterized protein with beta-barrel porin domain